MTEVSGEAGWSDHGRAESWFRQNREKRDATSARVLGSPHSLSESSFCRRGNVKKKPMTEVQRIWVYIHFALSRRRSRQVLRRLETSGLQNGRWDIRPSFLCEKDMISCGLTRR
jgi:hypothetical protein